MIQLYLGPMFSGKTTEMFRQVKKRVFCGNIPLVLRYERDARYVTDTRSPLASSHDAEQLMAMPCSDPWNDAQVRAACDAADVIGVDEGQFMDHLPEFCQHYASAGKTIIVAALDGTWERKPWPQITRLIPLSDYVIKLHAVCVGCRREASFSRRLDAQNTALEDIGGTEKYVACCRACFERPTLDETSLAAYKRSAERLALLQSK